MGVQVSVDFAQLLSGDEFDVVLRLDIAFMVAAHYCRSAGNQAEHNIPRRQRANLAPGGYGFGVGMRGLGAG